MAFPGIVLTVVELITCCAVAAAALGGKPFQECGQTESEDNPDWLTAEMGHLIPPEGYDEYSL